MAKKKAEEKKAAEANVAENSEESEFDDDDFGDDSEAPVSRAEVASENEDSGTTTKVGGLDVEPLAENTVKIGTGHLDHSHDEDCEFIVAKKKVGPFSYGQRIKKSDLPEGADIEKLLASGCLSEVARK